MSTVGDESSATMTLLDFPPEILCLIIDEVFPEDLPNFVSSCRDIHTLAQRRLMSHRDLMKRFSTIEMDSDGPSVPGPFELLERLLENRFAARYTRELVYLPWRLRSPERNDHGPNAVNILPSSPDLWKLLNGCRWLTVEERGQWQGALRSGDQGKAFLLLLNIMPNLLYVEIGETVHFWKDFDKLLSWILAQDVNDPDNRDMPLNKMSSVLIEYEAPVNGKDDLSKLRKIACLPSLRFLTAHGVEGGGLLPLEPSGSLGNSQVESILLGGAWMNAEDLVPFWKLFPKLHTIDYAHGNMLNQDETDEFFFSWWPHFEYLAGDWMEENHFVAKLDDYAAGFHISRV